MLLVDKVTVGPLQENTYVVYNDAQEALIIDPGAEPEKIQAMIDELGVIPQAILITHAHHDHVGACQHIREAYQVDVYVHEIEAEMFQDPERREIILNQPTDHYWTEADMGEVQVGSFKFRIAFTPGHSPGHVIYVFDEDEFVINGDTVFSGTIGRTDLPGGSFFDLMTSIDRHIISLPPQYTLFAGHGDVTTVGHELKTNPFFEVFRQHQMHRVD